MLVTVRETTEKKKAEEKLKISEQRFKDTVRQAPAGIAILRGKQFVVEMANDAYLELVDREKTSFVGKPLFASLPEVETTVRGMLEGVMNTGVPFRGNEVPIPVKRRGKEAVYYFDFLYHPLKEEDGTISGIIVTVTEVTDKVRAATAVKEKEQQLQSIFINTPAAIAVITGSRHSYVLANNAYQHMIGRTAEQLLGNASETVFPELAGTGTFEIFDSIYQSGEPFSIAEYPVKVDRHNIGTAEQMYFRFSAVPLKDAAGDFNSIVIVSVNITEQVVARKKLEQSEQRFKNLVRDATVAITVVTGPDMKFEIVNKAYSRIVNVPEQYMIGKSLFSVFPAAEAYYRPLMEKVMQTGEMLELQESPYTMSVNGKDTECYLHVVYQPYRDGEGNILGVMSIIQNVTEAVTARKKIEESEERFRTLAQALPQLVWLTDAQGNAEFASYRWKEYSGIEPAGENEWKAVVHPDDYNNINAAWVHSLSTGSLYTAEVRLRNKDGEYRWHVVNGEPIRNSENNIIKWVGAFTDIHEQKINDERKDEFISIASHEMRTPLTSAKGYLQLLELTLEKNNKQEKIYANKALQGVDRLSGLISELLDVSKMKLSKMNYNISSFNFNTMVADAVENIQLVTASHSIVKTGTVQAEVSGDKERLQQVIINLLTNAVKYSPREKEVFIHVQQHGDMVKVSVTDTGAGLTKQHLSKIFDKYYRVPWHTFLIQGLGIGLYISSEIIQRHHGQLWAESELGKGSTFYFTIPVNHTALI